MTHKELSIIIPCYNCSSTLEDAVNSIFEQNIQIPFEVVMVDDGSTDGTRALMESMSKKHPEIRIFFHEKNMGGGATRNTAVENSVSDLIFCLDSDDMLPKETLSKMVKYLKEKKCDGVLFEETRFFYDKNTSKTENIKNEILDRAVEIGDFFRENVGFLVQVNFLYTRKSFDLCGGYPTDHGFDTQNFGLRFLATGSSAFVCPGTHYLHRRSTEEISYFMREFNEGKASFNMYFMYEDIMHLLSSDVIKEIYLYDIMCDSRLSDKTLGRKILDLFQKKQSKDFFISDYRDSIKKSNLTGLKDVDILSENRDDFSNKVVQAINKYKIGDYKKSIILYTELVKENPSIKMLYISLMRSLLYESGLSRKESNENTFKIFYNKQPLSKLLLLARKIEKKFKKVVIFR